MSNALRITFHLGLLSCLYAWVLSVASWDISLHSRIGWYGVTAMLLSSLANAAQRSQGFSKEEEE